MIGTSKEIRELALRATQSHVGFCFCRYDHISCVDCPTEMECLKLFLKEEREDGTD